MPSNDEYWKAHAELKGEVGEIKGEVKGIKNNVEEIKTDQKAGFENISGRIDDLIKVNGNKPKNNTDKRISMFGLEIPRKHFLWFVMGILVALYILMSQFPGLMNFLDLVNGGANKVLHCEKNEDGKMECQGSIEELNNIIHDNSHGDNE